VLNLGVTKKLFQVRKDPGTTIDSPFKHDIAQFDWKSFCSTTHIPNARLVSPWLMRTGWHLHVQPYNVAKLCGHVAVLAPDIFERKYF
jgi:hypothetical protein